MCTMLIGIYFIQPETKFLITSEGATATTWLSDILNTIPKISCTHYNHVITKKHNDGGIDMGSISLEGFFKLIKKNSPINKRIYGNVHGFVLNTVLETQPKEIRIANLIRHPISHLDSMHKFWLRDDHLKEIIEDFMTKKSIPNFVFPEGIDQYNYSYNEALHYAAKLQELGITLEEDVPTWTFLVLLGRYHRVHADIVKADLNNIPNFKFEEFTENTTTLHELIKYISNNNVHLSQRTLEKLISTPASNVNNRIKITPKQIFASWQPWQRHAFAIYLEEIGGAYNNAYSQHGYDLSFVAP